jgi:FtsP/CotA-like multicopper oxidase with cupredoxin domain
VAVAALAATAGSSASGATPTIELCAATRMVTMSDGTIIPIWGFATPPSPGDCTGAVATLPGPVIDVNEGDTVTINVIGNTTPHAVSLEIPGTNLKPLSATSWQFTASDPGSYLYQSSADAGRATAMGLYGALIVRSATANQAYDSATTAYTDEATLVLSQIDPNFNNDPDGTTPLTDGNYKDGFRASYWLINGKAWPDPALSSITHPNGSRLLLRFMNAGYDNTSMSLLGIDDTVVARSAQLLHDPILADNETIPAGATEDAIVDFTGAGVPPTSNGFPLFNRELHVTNGQVGFTTDPGTGAVTITHPQTDATTGGGGMMTFIHP